MKNKREMYEHLVKGGKLRDKNWPKEEYVNLNEEGELVDNEKDSCDILFANPHNWEIYKEPKKRYWIWKVKAPSWFKTSEYLDDQGNNSLDDVWIENWDSVEKVKIEDDFVEVRK
jgi:hypothetical protein